MDALYKRRFARNLIDEFVRPEGRLEEDNHGNIYLEYY